MPSRASRRSSYRHAVLHLGKEVLTIDQLQQLREQVKALRHGSAYILATSDVTSNQESGTLGRIAANQRPRPFPANQGSAVQAIPRKTVIAFSDYRTLY